MTYDDCPRTARLASSSASSAATRRAGSTPFPPAQRRGGGAGEPHELLRPPGGEPARVPGDATGSASAGRAAVPPGSPAPERSCPTARRCGSPSDGSTGPAPRRPATGTATWTARSAPASARRRGAYRSCEVTSRSWSRCSPRWSALTGVAVVDVAEAAKKRTRIAKKTKLKAFAAPARRSPADGRRYVSRGPGAQPPAPPERCGGHSHRRRWAPRAAPAGAPRAHRGRPPRRRSRRRTTRRPTCRRPAWTKPDVTKSRGSIIFATAGHQLHTIDASGSAPKLAVASRRGLRPRALPPR